MASAWLRREGKAADWVWARPACFQAKSNKRRRLLELVDGLQLDESDVVWFFEEFKKHRAAT